MARRAEINARLFRAINALVVAKWYLGEAANLEDGSVAKVDMLAEWRDLEKKIFKLREWIPCETKEEA